MFARTQRLMLRPGWTEDAPELARAINYHEVIRHLSRAPWPYAESDAEQFLSFERGAGDLPSLLITDLDSGTSRIVGAIGLDRTGDGSIELGYWLTPDVWGRGYATEAGHAIIAMAHMLRVPALTASHFADNPASGRVLQKLGFTPTGRTQMRHSLGRGAQDVTVEYSLNLKGQPAHRRASRTAREHQSVSISPVDGRMAA